MHNDEPTALGKFNYHSYKEGKYNLMFVPFEGATACIVARDLDEYQVRRLMNGFNRGLERHVYKLDVEEYGDDRLE